jgi:hypothetical protein
MTTRKYPTLVFVTLYCILLVQFGIEALGKKNVKSPLESSWNKLASGVEVTSRFYFCKNLTANNNICDFESPENELLRPGQKQLRLAIIKCCGKKKCYSNLEGNRRRNDSRKVC